MTLRVVFDCNVFFQALISPRGPAGECLQAIRDRRAILFVSDLILHELTAVCRRPAVAGRFAISEERLDAFVASIEGVAVRYNRSPSRFEYPRDPDDAVYVNLAIATRSDLLVSRDNDLLALARPEEAEACGLTRLSPRLRILSPGEFLKALEAKETN